MQYHIMGPRDAIWRSSLVQVMACRVFGAKPLSEPMPAYYQYDPPKQNILHCNLNQNTKSFIQKNAFKMSSVKSEPYIIISGIYQIYRTHIDICIWGDFISKHPGGRLNKKDGLTRYGDSHVKDKTS